MCGIAGIVYDSASPDAARAAVRRMIALQRHRGPDGEGFYDTAGVSLGHCRLAIIDLTDAGHQPMSDPEGRYWITFNGEIYNYLELAEELRGLGYQFQGRSDTEALLAAYRHWGKACLERLRGMFAFAIWDRKERRLFAARDRLGIKPFHYWVDGNRQLAFASELKSLLEFLPQRSANAQLAGQFLAWNLLDHEPADTMVGGIKRLPPAHAMTWRQGEGLRLWRYWDVAVSEELEATPGREAEMIEEFRHRFEETVSLHLRSDVPVGICLSGGLDSSAIACVVRTELRRRDAWQENWQHTFSACFDEPHLDERPYIEAVVSKTGCTPHYVFPRGEELAQDLDRWLWHQEEPVGGSGAYAQYCVARLARSHGIKVLLDGQGADEQLAGYRKFILVYLRQLVRDSRYARAGREAVAFLLRPEILRTSRLVDGRRYLWSSLPEIGVLWPSQLKPPRPETLGIGDCLARRLEADMTRFSLPVLLRFEDRNMMAFGVESRVPFVDHVFVEWLAKLPTSLRLSGGWSKRILREAMVGVLPECVRQRRSKLGFLTPEPAWLAGPLSSWLRDTLAAPHHLGNVVDLAGVSRLLAQRAAGDRSLALENMLFRLAIYESWGRQFLEPASQHSLEHSTRVSRNGEAACSRTSSPRKPLPHVLMVSNHWEDKKNWPSAGVFVDRQIDSLIRAGVKISTFDIGTSHSPIQILRKWLELRKLVRRLNPDLVHGHYGTIVGFLSAFVGRPAVISYCGNDLQPGASVSRCRLYLGFLLSNLAALRARALICKSGELRRALWWRRDRAVVIPNGVDLDLFSPGPQETARKQLNWELCPPIVILNVRNDPKNKGLDLATAAMKIVLSRIPEAQLRIIENVEPDLMPLYYRAADALLCVSRAEGSPNVVKEALACNLPVVSAPVGDVPERLAGVHPSAVVPRDPKALAYALVQVLLKRERSNGREHIADLGLQEVARRVLHVYQSCLKVSLGGPPETEEVEIVPIQRGLMLREVADLHLEAFAGYLNVKLGRMYIKATIEWFMRAEGAIAIAAVDCQQRVLGYAIGARVGYDRMLYRDLSWIAGVAALMRPLVFFNRSFWRVVRNRLKVLLVAGPVSPYPSDLPEPVISLVSIAVASSARRRGIGLRLMRAFEAKAQDLGVRSLELSVYTDRTATRRFYEKCGWRPCVSATGEGATMKYCRQLDQDAQGYRRHHDHGGHYEADPVPAAGNGDLH
jgi:asparagine synthase (glutamine-hydrolysing)